MKQHFKTYLLAFLLLMLYSLGYGQSLKLLAPENNARFKNNRPTLVWNQMGASKYDIYIDNIKMETVEGSRNSTVPFPLSFGKHVWKVVAITKSGNITSKTGNFTINDKPLARINEGDVLLRYNWKVKSSQEVGADGRTIASPDLDTNKWSETTLPATVLTALVRNGLYPNPYIAKNNMLIPDANDDYNREYDLLRYSHIPNKNPWIQPYWYRTEFESPKQLKNKIWWLNFSEINYRAEIWLNGVKIGDKDAIVGMERSFKINVSKYLKAKGKNVLAVSIYPPDHTGKPAIEPLAPLSDPGQNMADGAISRDYTKWDVMGWDWQPAIRDRDMGITEDVFLSSTSNVELSDLYVSSKLNLPDISFADIAITTMIQNYSNEEKKGVVNASVTFENGSVFSVNVPYSIKALEAKEILIDKSVSKLLTISNPNLWWPAGYGKPNLYTANVKLVENGNVVSEQSTSFGIRQVETYISQAERVYKINGRKIYPKGGNWVMDMMLNWNHSRYEQEILLTANANLNMLRVWGPTGVTPQALFDAADKHGILMWQDFLNDFWGTYKNTPGYQPELSLFTKASIEIVKKLRNHPSLIIWCGGNEGVNPREEVLVNTILKKYDAGDSRHYLKQSDGDGLHGGGPYHTLEPKDYFTHPKLKGFSSEIGPSGVPEYESIAYFIPTTTNDFAAKRFPIDGVWAYHDANNWPGEDSRKFTSYDDMVRKYYGSVEATTENGVEAYIRKCQLVNYEVYKASIESINRQLWDTASGVLLWKSNSSWPSLTWQIYDWYLQSHAGYYGAKKASEKVHVQLNKATMSVDFISLLSTSESNIKVKATLVSATGIPFFEAEKTLNVLPDSATNTGIVIPPSKEVSFLKLEAFSATGKSIADNIYWLQENNDFTSLNVIPEPTLEVKAESAFDANRTITVTVKNSGNSVAVLAAFKVVGKQSNVELLPSLWSDNYVTMLPGETKILSVKVDNDYTLNDIKIEYKTYSSNKKTMVEVQKK
jgi:beta-galactosidase/beta-glucuronidase